jgi:uncharacterized protein (TIGR00299 family) protein
MSELRGCWLHFDCFAGIAGDMTLGALLDLGVPEEAIVGELRKLPVEKYRFWHERVKRGALVGTKVHVDVHDHDHKHDHDHAHVHEHGHAHAHPHDHTHEHTHHHAHVHYAGIRKMLNAALSGEVLARSLAMFDRIAEVEARLHGVTVEEVAFHEVGAVDSIVDIVGTAAGLAWLEPARVTSRRVPLGGGTVDTAHGRLPVPAPATLELLRGADVEAGGDSELTTPTGAAILAASAIAYGDMPPMTVVGVGWGAGDRQLADRPNLLRLVAGRPHAVASDDEVVVLEANVDDMSPELCEPLMDALFAAGALDAWFSPIVMKKSRPAILIGAIAPAGKRAEVADALLRNSTSLGVRAHVAQRSVLERRVVEVETEFGKVPVKLGGRGGEVWNAAPEYEACKKLAAASRVPVKQVYLAALAAWATRARG